MASSKPSSVTLPRPFLVRILRQIQSESVCLPGIRLPQDESPDLWLLCSELTDSDYVPVEAGEIAAILHYQSCLIDVLREAAQRSKRTMREEVMRQQETWEAARE
jgi:hypothetical protein